MWRRASSKLSPVFRMRRMICIVNRLGALWGHVVLGGAGGALLGQYVIDLGELGGTLCIDYDVPVLVTVGLGALHRDKAVDLGDLDKLAITMRIVFKCGSTAR